MTQEMIEKGNELTEHIEKLNCPEYSKNELQNFMDAVLAWQSNPTMENRVDAKMKFSYIDQTVKLQVYNYGLPVQVLQTFRELCAEYIDAAEASMNTCGK